MRYSRHLETGQFASELNDLRILHFPVSLSTLERLERQRILIPKIRLRYPDTIERRWFAKGHHGFRPTGPKEPNGPRWNAACALEAARQRSDWPGSLDPLLHTSALDHPKTEWRQFIQYPARRKFVPWADYRVRVDGSSGEPTWHNRTAVAYYTSWQMLLFIECYNMGTRYFGNTEDWDFQSGVIPESWTGGGIEFQPIRSLRAFRQFERQLDTVVWFAEEKSRNNQYILLRQGYAGRRLVEAHERSEIEERYIDLAKLCRKRFKVSYPQIIELIKFLCERWGDWEQIGCQNHVKAYKSFIANAISIARYLKDVSSQQIFDDVGRVTGHFKPTLRVIFRDWASEWREDAERLIVSFSRPGALLKADFTSEQANAFLDFVEKKDIFEFYWRWKSLNERAFSGDNRHLAGLKSDLQGMALSVEHIVHAMLVNNVQHPNSQLYEQCKQIWPKNTAVGKLLASGEYRNISQARKVIDLDWFETKQSDPISVQIASDLAICQAIRGNAHHQIAEENQLRLERMSLILLRGVVRAFVEASSRWTL